MYGLMHSDLAGHVLAATVHTPTLASGSVVIFLVGIIVGIIIGRKIG